MNTAAIHDALLALMPEGAQHNEQECVVCLAASSSEGPEGGAMSKTYSEEEVQALVAAAVAEKTADLQAKLDEFSSAARESEVEAKVAERTAELEETVTDLQAKLDAAVIEASTAKAAHDEIVAFLDAAKAEQERAAEIAALREERVAAVAAVVSFPADYVEDRAAAWAEMSADAFEACLADYKAVAAKAAAPSEQQSVEPPKETAFAGVRPETATTKSKETGSALRELMDLRRTQGISARAVR